LSASDYDDFNISFRGEYVLCNLKAEFILGTSHTT